MTQIGCPRGAFIPVIVTRPHPSYATNTAVVLAPGRNYDMSRPLLARCAETLAEAGITTVRFDWAYTASGGEASEDNDNELEDLRTALVHARELDGIEHVVLAGKSMGSRVAARAAADEEGVVGLMLLTPALHTENDASAPWPGREALWSVDIPTFIAVGDADPLCCLEELGAVMPRFPQRPRVIVAPGDHGFNCVEDPAQTAVSLNAVANTVATWAADR